MGDRAQSHQPQGRCDFCAPGSFCTLGVLEVEPRQCSCNEAPELPNRVSLTTVRRILAVMHRLGGEEGCFKLQINACAKHFSMVQLLHGGSLKLQHGQRPSSPRLLTT